MQRAWRDVVTAARQYHAEDDVIFDKLVLAIKAATMLRHQGCVYPACEGHEKIIIARFICLLGRGEERRSVDEEDLVAKIEYQMRRYTRRYDRERAGRFDWRSAAGIMDLIAVNSTGHYSCTSPPSSQPASQRAD